MSFRTEDYEPQGGGNLPEGLVLWVAVMMGGAFLGGVPLALCQLIAGRPPTWLAIASTAAGVVLGAWIVKPWRR